MGYGSNVVKISNRLFGHSFPVINNAQLIIIVIWFQPAKITTLDPRDEYLKALSTNSSTIFWKYNSENS